MNLEFEISPITDAYEEIFFVKNQGHYLKSPQTKGFFRKFVTSLVVTIIIMAVALSISNFTFDSPPTILLISLMILFCVGQLMTIIFFLGFVQKALEIKIWKKQINEFLKKLKTTSNYKIILTDSSFTILQDDTEKILNWSSITEAEISSKYISLLSQDYFLIPSKCIEQDRYAKLRNVLSKKLKHAVTTPKLH